MRVLIADDHPLYREAVVTQVRRLYGAAQVDEAASLEALREMAENAATPYDLILADYYMPGMSPEALARLIGDFAAIPLAVISGSASRADVRAAVQAGARAYIPKTSSPEFFAHALQMVLAGGTSIPAELLAEEPAPDDGLGQLSPRERDVLKGLAQGLSNKEIGRALGLAEVTIKLHLRNIFRKLDVKNRAEAAVRAVKAGLG